MKITNEKEAFKVSRKLSYNLDIFLFGSWTLDELSIFSLKDKYLLMVFFKIMFRFLFFFVLNVGNENIA